MSKLEDGIKDFLPYWEEFKAQFKGAIVEWEWEDFDEGELLVLMHFGTTSRCQNPDERKLAQNVAEVLDIDVDQVRVEAEFAHAPSNKSAVGTYQTASGWFADVIIDLW